jgi:hypothetical protein
MGVSSLEPSVTKRSKRDDDESAARLVRVARARLGDLESEPRNEEEAAAIAQLRKELPRPTAEEIAARGRKLGRRP